LEPARAGGVPVDVVPVDAEGTADLDALARLLEADDTPALVCLMHANNETGAIQPVAEAAAIARAHGALLHVDAVQTAGRIVVDMTALGADTIALSSHKIGGPTGTGALVLRSGLALAPMIRGGGQERARRSGTENLPGIAGFAAASEIVLSLAGDMVRVGALRDRLEERARAAAPDLRVWSADAPRLANTTCFSVAGLKAETLVIALDLAGIAVSSGSACSSGKVAASTVLAAMGVPSDLATGAVRVSLGWGSTDEDVDRFAAAWTQIMAARPHKGDIAA
jgi:cysteine desulfurase